MFSSLLIKFSLKDMLTLKTSLVLVFFLLVIIHSLMLAFRRPFLNALPKKLTI